MKDTRFQASLAAAGRVFRWTHWKPRTYEQAWLFAPAGPTPVGWILWFLSYEVYKGWPSPVALPLISYPIALVIQGLGWSYGIYERGEA